jgi:hypothetical protein
MSDEDRLRESLHRQIADVPALDDLDDVAARIARGTLGRKRRVAALVVAGLTVGGLGGFVVGRAVTDNPATVTVGGAPESTGAQGTTPTTNATPISRCATDEPLQEQPTVACNGPAPTLPAPGPDQPADATAARAEVARAYAAAYDGDASNSARVGAIEDGAGLVGVFDELRHGPVGAEVRAAKTVIDGIVFVSPTRAAVEFHSDLGGGGTSGPYFGDAVLNRSGWQISHASYCQIIIPAGAHCPE